MPESEASAPAPKTIGDLVGAALAPTIDAPPRAFHYYDEFRLAEMLSYHSSSAWPDPLRKRDFGIEEMMFDQNLALDAMARMFDNPLGRSAVNRIGNERRTLDIIQTLAVDIMLEAARVGRPLGSGFDLSEDMRRLFVPAQNGLPPTLLILDPARGVDDTERITDQIAVITPLLVRPDATDSMASDEQSLRARLLADPESIRAVLRIAQPEVVLSRRPVMERLCVPKPMLQVASGAEISTAGIYCRDNKGVLGVTACYHGTGPEGTPVTVDGVSSAVAAADRTQDIVFVPLPQATPGSMVPGVNRVLSDRTPSQYGNARFEGATSGETPTSISSHDAGLLRNRTSLQLKVQTPADTDKGDSGAALIDQDNNVIGFAFEKSGYGENPQITDWIWAANALRSLDLTPA